MSDDHPRCVVCDSVEDVQPSGMHGPYAICGPCYMVWYEMAITDPVELRRESMRLKALGKFPWNRSSAEAK